MAPAVVYCDTSFLFMLHLAADPGRLKSVSPKESSAAVSMQGYHQWATLKGTRFVTSKLALEEASNKLLQTPLKQAVGAGGHSGWKALKKADPGAFSAALGKGRTALRKFVAWFDSSAILMVGGRSRLNSDAEHLPRRVAKYATALLLNRELDAMDAYQIAIARYYQILWLASADKDWLCAPRSTVLLP